MTALGAIKFLTIHCAATPEGRDVKADQLSAWDIAKFGQISYHHVIELNGKIVDTLPDTVLGAHVALHNHNNIGVCYVGGMDAGMSHAKDTRTVAQRASMLALIHRYQLNCPGIIVRGHRDWPNVHKDCPSFDVTSWLKTA